MSDNFSTSTPQDSSELPDELASWIEEQPVAEAHALKEVWALSLHAKDTGVEPDAARFEQLAVAVKASTASDSAGPLRGHLRLLRTNPVRMAAAILVLAIAGGLFWMRPVVYEAPLGNQRLVQLADGSEVLLNSGSRLEHRRAFDRSHRNVVLHGEGFFDVAHDATPFTVQTFNGEVRVLGTRFNVRAWHSDVVPETEVVLEEGSVQFSAGDASGEAVVLMPGQRSAMRITATRPTAPERVDPVQRTAWRNGGFLFVNRQVGVVLDEVARRFDVIIEVYPAALRNEMVSLKLNDTRDAEAVLQTIAAIRGYTFEKSGEVYRLSVPPN